MADVEPIPVFSLWQPWATAVAELVKRVETRGKRPPASMMRRRLALHAAKRVPTDGELALTIGSPTGPHPWIGQGGRGELYLHDAPGFEGVVELPLGAIIATFVIRDCFPTEHVQFVEHRRGRAPLSDFGNVEGGNETFDVVYVDPAERPWGNYTPGRWAWVLGDVEPLERPCPFLGGQGFSRSWHPGRAA